MQLDNYELTTLDYALRYYLKENPTLQKIVCTILNLFAFNILTLTRKLPID